MPRFSWNMHRHRPHNVGAIPVVAAMARRRSVEREGGEQQRNQGSNVGCGPLGAQPIRGGSIREISADRREEQAEVTDW